MSDPTPEGIARGWEAAATSMFEANMSLRRDMRRQYQKGRDALALLDDAALLDELVRRGVLREVEAECDDEVEYGYCHNDLHWSLDRQEGTRRYVTAWRPDTRTPQQRSDAVDELRRRPEGGAP